MDPEVFQFGPFQERSPRPLGLHVMALLARPLQNEDGRGFSPSPSQDLHRVRQERDLHRFSVLRDLAGDLPCIPLEVDILPAHGEDIRLSGPGEQSQEDEVPERRALRDLQCVEKPGQFFPGKEAIPVDFPEFLDPLTGIPALVVPPDHRPR